MKQLVDWCRSNRHWLLLGLLFGLHVVTNVEWLKRDLSLRGYDSGPHVEAVARAYGVIAHDGLAGLAAVARGRDAGMWPSAGYLLWVGLSAIFGLGYFKLRLFNLLFSGVLVLTVFLLGERLHSRRAGLLGVAVVLLYPGIYGESRQFGIDYPAAALAALGLLLLLRTERLSRRGPALVLGAVVGLGVLIRPQVLFFLLFPGLTLLALGLIAPGRGTGRLAVLRNTALALLAAVAVSGVWWLGRLDVVLGTLLAHQQGDDAPLMWTASFYLRHLPWVFSPLLLVLFLISQLSPLRAVWGRAGLRSRLRRWRDHPDHLLVWIGLLSGLLLHFTLRVQCIRYLIPLCPLLAALTGAGLTAIRWRGPRRVIVALGLGAAAFTFSVDSFGRYGSYDFRWTIPRASESRLLAVVADLRVTSGPPQVDPVVLAGDRIGRYLRRRHGEGDGVLVHLINRVDPPNRRFWLAWYTTPLIRTWVPTFYAAGQTYYESRGIPGHFAIGGAEIPLLELPPRHCYALVKSPAHAPPPLVRKIGARRRLHLTAEQQEGQQVRLDLWELTRCAGVLKQVKVLQ